MRRRLRRFTIEGVSRKQQIRHDPTSDEVFLDDAFGVGGGDIFVPGAFGIDDRDGSVDADAKAVAFGAIGGAIGAGDIELLRAFLDIVPCLLARSRVDAIGADADEKMAREFADSEFRGDCWCGDFVGIAHEHMIAMRTLL